MIAAIWIVTLLLVGLAALPTWGLATLLGTDGAWVAKVDPWLARIPFGGWLESWFPDWLSAAHALVDALQSLLAWLGAAAPVIVWLLWGGVALALVLVAALLTLVVVLVRRNMPPPTPPSPVATA